MGKRLRTILLALLAMLLPALPAAGQVSGVVFDEQGAPVAQASVMVYADSLLKPPFLGYAITNGQGRFSIAVGRERGMWLSVRSVGHAAAAMPLAEEDSVVQVALTGDAHLMDEVLVKGRYSGIKVLGDTIRFDTGYFRTGAEDNLADVLRRLPGVKVEDDGTVSYGDKAVDDVLIDGRKVFDSRDGSAVVATLSAKHVTGAEIWQNYKPDSIASDKPRSDRQALNVKTDGVKASGSAAVGAGWQDAALADARLMLMRGNASATLRMAANNVMRTTISDTDFQNSLRGTEKWISDNTSTSNMAAGGGVMTSPPGDSRRARSAAPQLSLNLRPSGRLTLRLAALGNAMSYGTRSVATETYLSDNSRREWGRESHDIYRFGNVSASAKYKASPKVELGAAAVYSHQDARGSSASTDSSPGGMNLLDRRRDNANQLHLTTYATARAGRTVTRVYGTLLRKSRRETLSLLSDTLLLPLAYAPGGSGALPYALGSLRRERLTEGNIEAATDIRLDKRGHKVYAGVEMGVRSSTISDDTASPQAPADHRTDRTAALRVAFGRESMGLTYKAGARLWRAGASGGGQYAGDGSWYVDPDLSMSLQLQGGHSLSASWQCSSRLTDAALLSPLWKLSSATSLQSASGMRSLVRRMPMLMASYFYSRPRSGTFVTLNAWHSRANGVQRLCIAQQGAVSTVFWDGGGLLRSTGASLLATSGVGHLPLEARLSASASGSKGNSLLNGEDNTSRHRRAGGSLSLVSRFRGSWNGELSARRSVSRTRSTMAPAESVERRWGASGKASYARGAWRAWLKVSYSHGSAALTQGAGYSLCDVSASVERRWGAWGVKCEADNLLHLGGYTWQSESLTPYSLTRRVYELRPGFVALSATLRF